MVNIHEILKNIGIEIPEDKKTEFDKAITENYKTIAEVKKINDKLDIANNDLIQTKDTLQKMSTEFETFKQNSSTAEDFKTKYETLLKDNETKEQQRQAEELEKQERAEFDSYFVEKEKEWANPLIADGYFSKYREAKKAEENKNKMSADIIYSLVKDDSTAFKTPASNSFLKGKTPTSNTDDEIAKAKAVMGIK